MLNGGLYERTHVLLGDDGVQALMDLKVLVVGLGGVGGYAAESLCRAGVGTLTIVDHDVVSISNKNRQILALDHVVGQSKVEVMRQRLIQINAECAIYALDGFLLPQDMKKLLNATLPEGQTYSYVVDCIDSIECKAALLEACLETHTKCVTSGGAGGRMDPSKITQTDINDVMGDAMMTRMRHEVRFPRGVIRCVWSTEEAPKALPPQKQESPESSRPRPINGTISYMPAIFGNWMASVVIRRSLAEREKK